MSGIEQFILAVDLGTSGAKVALISTRGRVLDWEFEAVATHLTPDGGAEQDPREWWRAFITAGQRLIGRGIVAKEAIIAVCCSTQGEGTIAVDQSGTPLTNCLTWMDMRGAPAVRKRTGGMIKVDGASALKALRWVSLTGGMPSLTGKDPAGHMLYIKEAWPHIYEKTYKFLNVLDYLNLCLTGRFVATVDSILTSWVTDNRRPDHIHYHRGLARLLGIDAEKLPEIQQCASTLGPLLPEVAEALGLTSATRVVAGAIDNTAAAIGSGMIADYQPHLYIGTSSWIAAHVPFKKTDINSRLASVPCAVPNRYLLTALQATAGGNLAYLRDNLFFAHDDLSNEAAPADIYQRFDTLAKSVPAGSNGVIVTPWLWGERAPVDDPNVRGGIHHLSLNNTRADIIRATLEGVAYNTRWLVTPVEKFLGRALPQIDLVGGGANSAVWCQIFADVLGIPVRQSHDPIQTNARGAAWIAAVSLGAIQFADIPQLVTYQHIYEPNAHHRAIYDAGFGHFVELYQRLKPLHQKLSLR